MTLKYNWLLFFHKKTRRAQDRNIFSTAHLNHSDKGSKICNVIRLLDEDRVAFFTSRKIMKGKCRVETLIACYIMLTFL